MCRNLIPNHSFFLGIICRSVFCVLHLKWVLHILIIKLKRKFLRQTFFCVRACVYAWCVCECLICCPKDFLWVFNCLRLMHTRASDAISGSAAARAQSLGIESGQKSIDFLATKWNINQHCAASNSHDGSTYIHIQFPAHIAASIVLPILFYFWYFRLNTIGGCRARINYTETLFRPEIKLRSRSFLHVLYYTFCTPLHAIRFIDDHETVP